MATVATCPSCSAPLALPEGLADDAALLCPTCDHQFALATAGPAPLAEAMVVAPKEDRQPESAETTADRPDLKLPSTSTIADHEPTNRDDVDHRDEARDAEVEPPSTVSFESAVDSGTATLSSWLSRETLTEPDEFSPTDTVPTGEAGVAAVDPPAHRTEQPASAAKSPDPLDDPALESLLDQLRGGLGDAPTSQAPAAKESDPASPAASRPIATQTHTEPEQACPAKKTVEFATGAWRQALQHGEASPAGAATESTIDPQLVDDEADAGRIDLESTSPTADSFDFRPWSGPDDDANAPSAAKSNDNEFAENESEAHSDSAAKQSPWSKIVGFASTTEPAKDTADAGAASSTAESPLAASPVTEEESLEFEATPLRRHSFVSLRTIGMAGGVAVGLCMGYGLLLTLGGRQYDSLGLLPTVGSGDIIAAGMAPTLSATDGPIEQERSAADDASIPPLPTAEPTTAERQAAFESPSGHLSSDESPTGESPSPTMLTSASEPASDRMTPPEPASFATPEAATPAADAPLASDGPRETKGPVAHPMSRVEVGIAGAPLYQIDDLRSAIAGAEQARADLAAASLSQPDQLALVGRSYAKLCEVAQVLTFLAKDSSHPNMLVERLKARDLFSRLFRHTHARDDSRQVAARWLQWSDRPHGGIFFTCIPRATGPAGSVNSYRASLADGQTVTLLSPEVLDPTRFVNAVTVGVIGCVIESPAERIAGYTGDAPQAVWVAQTISLPAADLD